MALVAVLAGLWFGLRQPQPPTWQSAIFYPEPRPIDPFRLVDDAGNDFTPADFEGRWDLVFFGFTHCPDVCPNTMSVLASVTTELEEAGIQPPRVTLISVDPERDDPEQLGKYVSFFDPDFRGATGDHEALAALTRNVGIAYFVAEHDPGERNYTVDHSASVLIIDPDGRLAGVLRAPAEVDKITADLKQLLG